MQLSRLSIIIVSAVALLLVVVMIVMKTRQDSSHDIKHRTIIPIENRSQFADDKYDHSAYVFKIQMDGSKRSKRHDYNYIDGDREHVSVLFPLYPKSGEIPTIMVDTIKIKKVSGNVTEDPVIVLNSDDSGTSIWSQHFFPDKYGNMVINLDSPLEMTKLLYPAIRGSDHTTQLQNHYEITLIGKPKE